MQKIEPSQKSEKTENEDLMKKYFISELSVDFKDKIFELNSKKKSGRLTIIMVY